MEIKRDSILKVRSDEAIFTKWRELASKVQLLGGIVQNDMDVSGAELEEWVRYCDIAIENIKNLRSETVKHIVGRK